MSPAPQFHGVDSIYFDVHHVPMAEESYVAWSDLMGVQSVLQRSVPLSANAIFKFHSAALDERPDSVHLYPVMDGLYAATPVAEDMRQFLSRLFARSAAHFLHKEDPEHRFIPKAAVAFGRVVHGEDVSPEASHVLEGNPTYRQSILIGEPMVRAYLHERITPPFGVGVDVSASDFLTGPERKLSHVWWAWYAENHAALAADLDSRLSQHYDWCEARAGAIDYPMERLRVHRQQAGQFLGFAAGA